MVGKEQQPLCCRMIRSAGRPFEAACKHGRYICGIGGASNFIAGYRVLPLMHRCYIHFLNANEVQFNMAVVGLGAEFADEFQNIVINKITFAAING